MPRIDRFFRSGCSLIVALSVALAAAIAPARAAPPPGLLVPLYADPAQDRAVFAQLIAAHQRHRAVPITVILNPDSGPGSARLTSYADLIRRLRSTGITVLGYIHTSYGKRDLAQVEGDVKRWQTYYGSTGFFVDEMAYTPGYEAYYRAISKQARDSGAAYIVGNPGVDTLASYVPTVDTIVIHEQPGLPDASALEGWHSLYGRSHFGFLAYAVPELHAAHVSQIAPLASQIYITDAPEHPTFRHLPAYLDELLAILEHADVGRICSTNCSPKRQ